MLIPSIALLVHRCGAVCYEEHIFTLARQPNPWVWGTRLLPIGSDQEPSQVWPGVGPIDQQGATIVRGVRAVCHTIHSKFTDRHHQATTFRIAYWLVIATEAHSTPRRVLSIYHDVEAAQAACEALRTHNHVWVEAGSHRARFLVCDVCSVRNNDITGLVDRVDRK